MLRLSLYCIGLIIFFTSRVSKRVRNQIACNFTVTIRSHQGIARTFIFKNRLASSRPGADPRSIFTLTFLNNWQAVKILFARDAVKKILDGLTRQTIQFEGDLPYLLWFYELVMAYVPGRHTSHTKKIPNDYVTPAFNSEIGKRIIRRSSTSELKPSWKKAHKQREKILLWRVGKGSDNNGKNPNFRHVTPLFTDEIVEKK